MTTAADRKPSVEVIEANAAPIIGGDAEVDRQVATARKYPRSVQMFIRKLREMATLSPEIAKSCIYALPRKEDGKSKIIEGPSARFAELAASSWGNLRAEGRVIGNDDQFVTSRGTAWDVENNVAIGYEVRRRITTSKGQMYSADMIAVTGNAGASIALRNALLKVIPTPFWKPIYEECRKVIAGDAKTFGSRRDAALHELGIIGVPEDRAYATLGVRGRSDITYDHLIQIAGLITAIRENELSIEEAFPDTAGAVQPAQRRSQQPAGGTTTGAGAPSTTDQAPADATTTERRQEPPAVANVGTIEALEQRGDAAMVKLSTGFVASTRDAEIIASLKRLADAGRTVELSTRASSDPSRFAPIITEAQPLDVDPVQTINTTGATA